MLRLDGVSKRYGRGRWILRDVDVELPAGEVIAVTGANGSGKSTLLRVLVGLSKPSGGTVSGRPEVVGYVPDRFPPNERLSAISYLTHMGRIRGLTTVEATSRADALIDRLALVGGKHAPLRTLSKGNAQKVALAQALLVPPGLLVLDEPWSGLDASTHGVLGEIIAEVARTGVVVFTDHREAVTRSHATRTYAVRDGAVTPGVVERVVAMTELVLTNPRDAAEPDWGAEVERHGSHVIVRVARTRTDAVLLEALRLGWSVESVRHGVTVEGAR